MLRWVTGFGKGLANWESSLWLGVVASGGTGEMAGDTLLVSVDALAGQGSSHFPFKGPVSEKPQYGHGQLLCIEVFLYSSGQELHAGPS